MYSLRVSPPPQGNFLGVHLLVGPEGKRLLGRLGHKWKDCIKMAFKELREKGVDWVHLAFDRDGWWVVMNTVITFGFHKMQGLS
jgi:hypothetical protein